MKTGTWFLVLTLDDPINEILGRPGKDVEMQLDEKTEEEAVTEANKLLSEAKHCDSIREKKIKVRNPKVVYKIDLAEEA